ncbi:helix-turn-helix domain-containing protein [Latilactobacillus curvatus]
MDLDQLYTAKEASLMLGKEASYIRTLNNKTPKKLPAGEYRKIGRELIITKDGIEKIRESLGGLK